MHGIERSLKRLQTDYLDLYQAHGWASNTPLEETLTTPNEFVRQGKVRYIGLSNYLAWQDAEAIGIKKRKELEKFVPARCTTVWLVEIWNWNGYHVQVIIS